MRDFDPTAGEFAGSDAIRLGSKKYDPATLIMGGASILGSAMGADAAGDAAAAQERATDKANALQDKQYQQTRTDLAPWRNVGMSASAKLAQLLGLGGGGGGASGADRDAIRARLLPQFTSSASPAPTGNPLQQFGQFSPFGVSGGPSGEAGYESRFTNSPGSAGQSSVDEAGLNAAIERELAGMSAQTDPNAADYGSLLKPFTGADLQNEPGYQFELAEGQKGLDRRAAAGGNYFSGAALKAAARYGNDYAGTKYGEAFNRDASTKRQTYDFLNGQSSAGQNAATMTANAGTQMAGQVGSNTTGLGNALGAAALAQGNAWSGGISSGLNNYTQNKYVGALDEQNALRRAVLGGNDSWRTTGNGMPDGY